MTDRRDFIKKTAMGTAALGFGGLTSVSAKSYKRIKGANDRIGVAFMGCGRRVPAYYRAVMNPKNNIDLIYINDVMQSQMENVAKNIAGKVSGKAELEEDFRKVFADKHVDAIFNATPDHWHAPGTWLALEAGKHVYVEKPISHNPYEGELLVKYQKKYGKVVQMGNQQRSAKESQAVVKKIHDGLIGDPYKAIAYYRNARGRSVNPLAAPAPKGLNWELFQGPAPREEYRHDTWNYNWHWYGWKWGTAETGNNATHELDIARWALKLDYPEHVSVSAAKRHFLDDGWEMYDSMDAEFRFPGNKIVQWDGQSRNNHGTYVGGRGTIIYGTDGSVHVDRGGYKLYDRGGKLIEDVSSAGQEGSTGLGGGGDMSTMHVENFFDAIRGKAEQRSPVDEGVKSTLLCHLANISYRANKGFDVNTENGHIFDREAMKFWMREYEPGWEPKL